MKKGRLIIFEGIDNVGKSIICEQIYKKLCEQDILSVAYSFPGREEGTLGKLVYDIHHDCLDIKSKDINPISLQVLHIAAHIDAIVKKILPAVNEGKVVLLDRSWWSTYAYGIGNVLDKEILNDILRPELRLFDQISDATVFYITRRNREEEYTEKKKTAILKAYDELCELPSKMKVVKIENDGCISEAVDLIYKNIMKGGLNK